MEKDVYSARVSDLVLRCSVKCEYLIFIDASEILFCEHFLTFHKVCTTCLSISVCFIDGFGDILTKMYNNGIAKETLIDYAIQFENWVNMRLLTSPQPSEAQHYSVHIVCI